MRNCLKCNAKVPDDFQESRCLTCRQTSVPESINERIAKIMEQVPKLDPSSRTLFAASLKKQVG